MVGVGGKLKAVYPAIRAQTVVLCSQQMTRMYRNHRKDRDSHWQQFGTQPILISAPQWACWLCNAPIWFYMVGKKLSVKADLAIYSQAADVCGRCMSESLILGHNLDFSSCDIMVSFRKSSHKSYRGIVLAALSLSLVLALFCIICIIIYNYRFPEDRRSDMGRINCMRR